MSEMIARPRWMRATVHSIRAATTVAALTAFVGLAATDLAATPPPAPQPETTGMAAGPLETLMQQHRCSFTGFDAQQIPSQAIVRSPTGATELVSFDRGWAIFRGDVAGELVAVCLGPDAGNPPVRDSSPTSAP